MESVYVAWLGCVIVVICNGVGWSISFSPGTLVRMQSSTTGDMAYRYISLYTTLLAIFAIRDRFRFLVPGTSAACATQSTRTCSSRTSWPTSSGSSRLLCRLACHDNETISSVSNYQTFCSCNRARPTRDPASLSYFCITSIWPTSSGCSSKVYTACNIM